jgi:hypothetical protein
MRHRELCKAPLTPSTNILISDVQLVNVKNVAPDARKTAAGGHSAHTPLMIDPA